MSAVMEKPECAGTVLDGWRSRRCERAASVERGEVRLLDEAEFFDEDAQVCECGHVSRDHHEKAFNYACCIPACDCRGFRGRGLTTGDEET